MFWGEERVHVGGFGGGDAAADGAQSPPHAAHAYRYPVPHHVPPTGRLRHEHPVPPHSEAGQYRTPAAYFPSFCCLRICTFFFFHNLSFNSAIKL